jgi:hypothetical protein
MPPFFARITISGDSKMKGVFEECMDPRSARARARPVEAPPPLTGCTSGHEMRRPGGPIIDRGEAARLLEDARGAAP